MILDVKYSRKIQYHLQILPIKAERSSVKFQMLVQLCSGTIG